MDSSLTLLVDNGYDDPGELSKLEFDTSDSIWGVLQYVLGCVSSLILANGTVR